MLTHRHKRYEIKERLERKILCPHLLSSKICTANLALCAE